MKNLLMRWSLGDAILVKTWDVRSVLACQQIVLISRRGDIIANGRPEVVVREILGVDLVSWRVVQHPVQLYLLPHLIVLLYRREQFRHRKILVVLPAK